ncbi:hypothetical protein [Terasakiella sp. SH-1]|uniref:hypothetical protein n=1 Tax=Terasakiella sp. SH-1 TaxID=2560057 RepID=UPI0010743B07|nr:hypothetical protein [Terasakiella sp. SH-1]
MRTVGWYYVAWVGTDNQIRISSYHHRTSEFEQTINTGLKTCTTPKLIGCEGVDGSIDNWSLFYFDRKGHFRWGSSTRMGGGTDLGQIWNMNEENTQIGRVGGQTLNTPGEKLALFPRQINSKLTLESSKYDQNMKTFSVLTALGLDDLIQNVTVSLRQNTGASACLVDNQICIVVALTGSGNNLKTSNMGLIVYDLLSRKVSGGLLFPEAGNDNLYLTHKTPTICRTYDHSGVFITWAGIDGNNSLNLAYLGKGALMASNGLVTVPKKQTTVLWEESSGYSPVFAGTTGENGLFWIGKDTNHQFNYAEVGFERKWLLWSSSSPDKQASSKHTFEFPSGRQFGIDVIGNVKEQVM